MDKTYIKVKGQWDYPYQAVDKEDQCVDVMVSEKLDEPATQAFPDKVTSLDLRKQAGSAAHRDMKKTEPCALFNIGKKTLYSWLRLEKAQGHLEPRTGF